MTTSNEIRRRLVALLTRFADEVGQEADEPHATPRGTGISSLTHHLGLLLAGASPANLATVRRHAAGFGSRVVVQDVGTSRTETHHLMASQAMDLGADHVSLESPLGAALVGGTAGAVVGVITPLGARTLRILSVQSLPELLDALEAERVGAG